MAAACFHRTGSTIASNGRLNYSIRGVSTILLIFGVLTQNVCIGSEIEPQRYTSNEDLNSHSRDSFDSDEEFIIANIMKSYNKDTLPRKEGMNVSVDVVIAQIKTLSEVNSEVDMDIFMDYRWNDPALNFSHLSGISLSILTLHSDYVKKIWHPGVCFKNSNSAVIHNSPSENDVLLINKDGTVIRSYRIKVKSPCVIDLTLFPFDKQRCLIVLESFLYNTKSVRLALKNPVNVASNVYLLPDFHMTTVSTHSKEVEFETGSWDQIHITLSFKRRFGYFIIQAYVPTYMVMFVAWINFLIDPVELGTRGTLCISGFIAMAVQFGTISQNIPRVGYIKALDIWMLGGLSFLLLALAELGVISYMIRSDRPKNIRHKEVTELTDRDEIKHANSGGAGVHPKIYNRPYQHRWLAAWFDICGPYYVDKFFLVVYPLLFFVFNVVYWGCYSRYLSYYISDE